MNLTLKKKSWHYGLATCGLFSRLGADIRTEYLEKKKDVDICSYTSEVMFGCVLTALSIFIGVGALLILGAGPFQLWTLGLAGLTELGNFSLAVWFVLTVIGFSALTVRISHYIASKRVPREKTDTEKFVKQAYSSFKNKYCIKLKFI